MECGSMSERDNRKSQRIAVELPMKLTLAGGESFTIKTWDFSDSGVFIENTENINELATVNSIVRIQFQGTNYTPPVMSAKVVRVTDAGIALILKDTLIEGNAP
jgi:hypothetical protein